MHFKKRCFNEIPDLGQSTAIQTPLHLLQLLKEGYGNDQVHVLHKSHSATKLKDVPALFKGTSYSLVPTSEEVEKEPKLPVIM